MSVFARVHYEEWVFYVPFIAFIVFFVLFFFITVMSVKSQQKNNDRLARMPLDLED